MTTEDRFAYQVTIAGLREAAVMAEDAQRALQHLEGILQVWDECPDNERREIVEGAVARLNGTWRAALYNPEFEPMTHGQSKPC